MYKLITSAFVLGIFSFLTSFNQVLPESERVTEKTKNEAKYYFVWVRCQRSTGPEQLRSIYMYLFPIEQYPLCNSEAENERFKSCIEKAYYDHFVDFNNSLFDGDPSDVKVDFGSSTYKNMIVTSRNNVVRMFERAAANREIIYTESPVSFHDDSDCDCNGIVRN